MLPETRTDADGVFAFAELAPGIWRVCAFTDVWRARMSEELELAPGEGRKDLMLPLASSGSLIGSLRIPPRVLEGGELLVEPVSGPLVEVHGYPAQAIQLPVAADGGFASGPLPPGSARVSWRMPSFSYRIPGSSQPRAHPGEVVRIGTFDIAPDSPTEVVLDLSAPRPAIEGLVRSAADAMAVLAVVLGAAWIFLRLLPDLGAAVPARRVAAQTALLGLALLVWIGRHGHFLRPNDGGELTRAVLAWPYDIPLGALIAFLWSWGLAGNESRTAR